jgi:probable rRNA maturation factor
MEGVRVPCEINVLFTDDEGIRALNRDLRGVDRATDVLSFPAFNFTPEAFDPADGETDPESGLLPLGDMALNLDRIRLQGREYGTGEKHETAYLTVHSVLHLLGYDHVDEGEAKKQMRNRERMIMRMMRL